MKTAGAVSFSNEVVIVSNSNEEPKVKQFESEQQQTDIFVEKSDNKFVDDQHHRKSYKCRNVFQHAKAKWDRPAKPAKVPWPKWEVIAGETEFAKNPTLKGFYYLEKNFNGTMLTTGHQKYRWAKEVAINADSKQQGDVQSEEFTKLEEWHAKRQEKALEAETKAREKTAERRKKIEEEGRGFGGKMTKYVGETKAKSFYAKNNLTIRGNVFKLTHKTCPKNIYEIMPRYGYRKSAHVGVRVSQFTINAFLATIGYTLIPVSFGISKIVADHTRTLVTLSGEAITLRIAGASKEKIMVHSSLRGAQLEIPRLIPIAGDVINIGESIALGTAAGGIVATTLADMMLQQFSTRYTSTMNADDLGDSRCLRELNSRIDYLSQFLLPYGQYLLLKESDQAERMKLKGVLRTHFKTLRQLEKKKIESLTFYRLALAADKVPKDMREKIRIDCENALPETRINTHRIVRQCLNTLIDQDPALSQLRPQVFAELKMEKEKSKDKSKEKVA